MHLFLFLSSRSSDFIKTTIGFKSAKLENANIVLLIEDQESLSSDDSKSILHTLSQGKAFNLFRRQYFGSLNILNTVYNVEEYFIQYKEIFFGYNTKTGIFGKTSYPTSFSLNNLLNYAGYQKSHDIIMGLSYWGPNRLEIPMPSFFELYLVSKYFFYKFNAS